MEALQVQL